MAEVLESEVNVSMSNGDTVAITAVIIATDDVVHSRLKNALRDANVAEIDAAADVRPDLIVVSGSEPVSFAHAPGDVAEAPGVIAIGANAAVEADVSLAVDFTARELALACRLLTQVVRLRRRLNEDARQGNAWREQASCDPLTKLPNRRPWLEELSRRIKLARSTAQPLCVALVDLDHFKQVNDGWGLAAGDQLLVAVAMGLRQSLRTDDFVARLGGDEFGLLLSGLDHGAAATVVERVRAGLPARVAQSTPFVTSASIGYSIYDGLSNATPEELLSAADRARRLAKTQGRARTAGNM